MKGRAWHQRIVKNDKMNSAIEEGLAAQMDIVDMLRWFRVFKLVSIANLRKNQMQMVKFFKEYSLCEELEDGGKIEESIGRTDLELDDLMKGFEPGSDYVDKIVLYMLTGRNMDNVMRDWLESNKDNHSLTPEPG